MIPYFTFKTIAIGPLTIQVWGLFVALGILAALFVARRAAARRGANIETVTDLISWTVLVGIIGARLGHVLLYDPARFLAEPMAVLRLWEGGMSMFGGFLGAAVVMGMFYRRHAAVAAAHLDAMAYAFPLGYGIGRIGCFLIHDHPGTLSHSLLAVKYPGGARFDHGMLLSLVGFAMFAWFWFEERRAPKNGDAVRGFLPRLMVCYGAVRFALDFLRVANVSGADVRHFGLTPAQYLSIVSVGIGIWWLKRSASKR